MFYRPGTDGHGLPHDPFKACVTPRPIAWISTRSRDGVANLAPFSFFNAFAWEPPIVAFGVPARRPDGRCKDTLRNVEETGEFVVNVPTYAQRDAVNRTSLSLPHDVDEFTVAGVIPAEATMVCAPRVAGSPIHLECTHHDTVLLPGPRPDRHNAIVLGRVVGVHISDDVLRDGRVDSRLVRPLARLGYRDWCAVDEVFEQAPPVLGPA